MLLPITQLQPHAMPSIRSTPQTALSFPLHHPPLHSLPPSASTPIISSRPPLQLLHNADALSKTLAIHSLGYLLSNLLLSVVPHPPPALTRDRSHRRPSSVPRRTLLHPGSPVRSRLVTRSFSSPSSTVALVLQSRPLRSSTDPSDPNDAPSPYRWAQSALLDRVHRLSPFTFSAGRPLVVSRSLDLPTKRAPHSRPSLHAFQPRSSHKQSPLSPSRPLAADATTMIPLVV